MEYGVIILILMMGTAFLGYKHSPKWLNRSISLSTILVLVFYTIKIY